MCIMYVCGCAGDGECGFRAILFAMVEGAALAGSQHWGKALADNISALYTVLPSWMVSDEATLGCCTLVVRL